MPQVDGLMGQARGFLSRWWMLLLAAAAAFLIAWFFVGRKKSAAATAAAASGVTPSDGPPAVQIVPVPGQSYTNNEYFYEAGNVNQPGSGSSTTPPGPVPAQKPPKPVPVGGPVPAVLPPMPPVKPPPTPKPIMPPVPAFKDYTVVAGDTLARIAERNHTTWQSLYQLNKGVIDKIASQHGNPVPGGPWNNIFPQEVIKIPG